MKFGNITVKELDNERYPLFCGEFPSGQEELTPATLSIDLDMGKAVLNGGSCVRRGYDYGTPEDVFNGRVVEISADINFLTRDEVESLCEAIAEDVERIVEEGDVEFDGSNYVGVGVPEDAVYNIQNEMMRWEDTSQSNGEDLSISIVEDEAEDFLTAVEELSLDEIIDALDGIESKEDLLDRIIYELPYSDEDEDEFADVPEKEKLEAIERVLHVYNVLEGLDHLIGSALWSSIEVTGGGDEIELIAKVVLRLL